MLKTFDQKTFKAIGVYIIVILALVRFAIYPLQEFADKEKVIFTELSDAYELKARNLERKSSGGPKQAQAGVDKSQVMSYFYERATPFSEIQADVLQNIVSLSEKKGLAVQSFEMLEPVSGKLISEIPITIRLAGKPADILEVIQFVVSEKKLLSVKSLEMNKSGQELLLSLNLAAYRVEK